MKLIAKIEIGIAAFALSVGLAVLLFSTSPERYILALSNFVQVSSMLILAFTQPKEAKP